MSTIYDFTIPNVIDRDPATGQGVAFDLFSRLMADFIILISSPIDDFVSSIVTGSLLYLDNKNREMGTNKDIQLYINSPGGSVTSGLAIFDTMKLIKTDVQTVAMGEAASMAAVLLSGGTKGKRFCLPHSDIMIHQPLGGTQGKADDVRTQALHMARIEATLYSILAETCNKTIDQIAKDCKLDNHMDARQAVEYGIIDDILY